MAWGLHQKQTYDFQVVHVAGKYNQAADALSRSNHLPPATKEEEAEEAEYIDAIKTMNELVYILSKEVIIREQKKDETVSTVREWVEMGILPKIN